MTWSGGMPMRLGDRSCTFTMAEDFTGPLAPLIVNSLPDFQSSFDGFAAALKKDSEA